MRTPLAVSRKNKIGVREGQSGAVVMYNVGTHTDTKRRTPRQSTLRSILSIGMFRLLLSQSTLRFHDHTVYVATHACAVERWLLGFGYGVGRLVRQ